VVTGSGAAFLVLESREHAERRGRPVYARLGPVASGRARRRGGDDLEAEIAALAARAGVSAGQPMLAISGASGAHAATTAEKAAFAGMPDIALRGLSTLTGHMKEAQFPFAVALAALAVRNRAAYPAFDAESEKPFEGAPTAVLATTVGYHQFEGMALVVAAD
jgi:3-oxoacyl-[acyl-carrier-protein] synthase II